MSRAGALRHVGRIEEAIIDCDELVKRIGDATEPRLVGCVVDGLHVKASALADSGRFDEAVEVLHGIVTRYSDATEPGLAIDVAWALHGKGRMLTKAGRVGEAIASYDDLVARLGDPTDAGELALAATTLNDEADLLLTADRTDEPPLCTVRSSPASEVHPTLQSYCRYAALSAPARKSPTATDRDRRLLSRLRLLSESDGPSPAQHSTR